jgi:iron complex outermembrane receptor protein
VKFRFALILISTLSAVPTVFAQNFGTIRGTVSLAEKDLTLPHVIVVISQLGRSVETGEDGVFEFTQVPPGAYDLVATRAGLTSEVRMVQVSPNQTATIDFMISISPIRQEITVTATGVEEAVFDSFRVVSTLDSFALAEKSAASVGEILDNQPGVAKRSSGPGSSRPVIRGFDGDRVLVMQDGVRTGSLASQSGDHGEPIDVMSIERLEVVKGPATLLYGSNAIGGVVNAVSRRYQMKEQSLNGVRGYLTGNGGSNNNIGSGGAGVEVGFNNFLIWGNGSNQKTRDYKAGGGEVIRNSGSRLTNGGAGVGYFGDRSFLSGGYTYDEGIYGIPLEEDAEEIVRLDFFRRNARISGGVGNLSNALGGLRFNLNYSGWRHKELDFADPENIVTGTFFDNKQYTYEFNVDQTRSQRLSGTFGFYGMHRNYVTRGEEAITPDVKANVYAVFGLEEISFDGFKLEFGGRLESTQYDPEGPQAQANPDRTFTGVSGSAGIQFPLWPGGAFVSSFTHSYRAPALEELYNNGPHPGNFAFEIGNSNLQRERSDGVDVSLRHIGSRIRAEANFFHYDLGNYVFLFLTGEEREGLREALFSQGNARYTGTELILNAGVHPNLWLDLGFDYVRATLKTSDTPLPRIPPGRGHIGIEGRYRGFSIKPEVILANRQGRVFTGETPTAGYALFNLNAAYTIPVQHFSHHIAFTAFNLGDRLYRNHLSLIKDAAPEIGRGVRLTYSVKFF